MENREIHNNLILEYKQEQEFKKRYNRNFIELDDYFKYSGKIEKPTDKYSIYEKKINKFNKFHNKNRDKIIKKRERYEKIISKEKSIEYNKHKKNN
tara:strand:+ start:584 stop:871 length:288 start_codon:yes stop_codon:yes gene_type:complete